MKFRGYSMNFLHYPVMNKEVVDIFSKTGKELFIDCTVGMGGHSYHILRNFKNSKIIAIDCDRRSLEMAKKNLKEFGERVCFHRFNYIEFFKKTNFLNRKVSAILVDPGISSYQLKDKNRGFSHSIDSRLDMRKDEASELTAFDVINSFSERQLTEIFTEYGEVKKAEELSKEIIERRLFGVIDSTLKLREIIEKIYKWKPIKGKIHPAAKVFQALRIFVNKELEGVEIFLKKIPEYFNSGTRIIFLSYHSIEDRIVKKTFRYLCKIMKAKIIKPFPGFPSKNEIMINHSSRSAKLRAVEVL